MEQYEAKENAMNEWKQKFEDRKIEYENTIKEKDLKIGLKKYIILYTMNVYNYLINIIPNFKIFHVKRS